MHAILISQRSLRRQAKGPHRGLWPVWHASQQTSKCLPSDFGSVNSPCLDLLCFSQSFEEANKQERTPAQGVIACLERLMTAAKERAPEVLRAGYAQLLPCVLTSLDALSACADVSGGTDGTMERLLTLVSAAVLNESTGE